MSCTHPGRTGRPTRVAGELDLQIAFEEAYGLLLTRIFQFLATHCEGLSERELSDALAAIGGPHD